MKSNALHLMKRLSAILALLIFVTGVPLAVGATEKKAAMGKTASSGFPTAEERRMAEYESARKLIAELTTTQKSKLLTLLNEGEEKDLSAIKGIAEARATSLMKARPFKDVAQVIHVAGFGEATFARVVEHGKTLTRRRAKTS